MTQVARPPLGVLLAQLGSPEAPTPAALRRYLLEFLSDRNVIDYPAWFWQPILRGVILPVRSPRSARLYRSIWMAQGSPLVVHSQRFAAALQERLGDGCRVALGMRYGNPTLSRAVESLAQSGIGTLIVVPMFPQASATTTGSIVEAVKLRLAVPANAQHRPGVPDLKPRYIKAFFDSPAYLDALAGSLRDYLASLTRAPEHVLVSFHGLPVRYVRRGDPYEAQCTVTAELLADRMGWRPGDWTLTYQSRFGPESWLAPSTQERITGLAGQGVRRLLVVAPSFVADCLETLSELGIEGREDFARAGGDPDGYFLAPSLNAGRRWVDAAASLVLEAAAAGE